MGKSAMDVVHYPSLKTVLAIEEVIKKAGAPLSRNRILSRLPTKTMRSTLNFALAYMEARGLVLEINDGFLWVFNPSRNLDKIRWKGAAAENDTSKIREDAVPILMANKVRRAAIFGSVARGEATPKSDVDFLVDFKGKVTLFDLGGLKADLEEKLKRRVDLVLFRSIDARMRSRILGERVDIL